MKKVTTLSEGGVSIQAVVLGGFFFAAPAEFENEPEQEDEAEQRKDSGRHLPNQGGHQAHPIQAPPDRSKSGGMRWKEKQNKHKRTETKWIIQLC